MRVLLVSEYFPKSNDCEVRGGAEARAFYLAKYLSRLGNQISVLSSRERGYPKEQKIGQVTVFRPGDARGFLLGGSFERAKFLKELLFFQPDFPFDIVDGQNVLAHVAAYYLGKKNQAKKVASYHDVWLGEWTRNMGIFWGALGEMTERWVLKWNWDLFVAVSDFTRKRLVKNGVKSPKIKVIKNGVDFSLIKKINASKENNPTICFVGRLYPYKRVDLLLRAVAKVSARIPEVRLRIVGSGPQMNQLKGLAKKLGVEKKVSFLGFVPKHRDVLKIIKGSHLFCLPSDVEGFGITTVEAMALGVPYVSSNIPATIEVTKKGKGGLLFERGDESDLAQKIETLLEDSRLYQRSKGEGEVLSRDYDWRIIASDLAQAYQSLL